jgi:hypothetical protein
VSGEVGEGEVGEGEVCVCERERQRCVREREREREREGERERERERETEERQGMREARERERKRDRETERDRESEDEDEKEGKREDRIHTLNRTKAFPVHGWAWSARGFTSSSTLAIWSWSPGMACSAALTCECLTLLPRLLTTANFVVKYSLTVIRSPLSSIVPSYFSRTYFAAALPSTVTTA